MFALLRNRLGIPGVISLIALVLAMAGGAYAAKKYIITSTSQIKPSVLKALQGKAGPAGAQGAPGTPGSQGAAGSAGKEGTQGLQGEPGEPGKAGKDGVSATTATLSVGNEHCAAGGTEVKSASAPAYVCNGSPWAAEGTLPSEATETGSWGGSISVTKEQEKGEEAVSSMFPISFTLPLAEEPEFVYVKSEETKEGCPGIVGGAPTAEPGKLCVYEKFAGGPVFIGISFNPSSGAPGVGKSGVLLPFVDSFSGTIFGAWAVTAK